MTRSRIEIGYDERALATLTHLSGLAGYIVPLGGVLVPILIWMMKKDSPIISSIARQAVLLNVTVFALFCTTWVLFLTILLIPVVAVAYAVIGVAALALPIIGAIKAADGTYYRYPVVGSEPDVVPTASATPVL